MKHFPSKRHSGQRQTLSGPLALIGTCAVSLGADFYSVSAYTTRWSHPCVNLKNVWNVVSSRLRCAVTSDRGLTLQTGEWNTVRIWRPSIDDSTRPAHYYRLVYISLSNHELAQTTTRQVSTCAIGRRVVYSAYLEVVSVELGTRTTHCTCRSALR